MCFAYKKEERGSHGSWGFWMVQTTFLEVNVVSSLKDLMKSIPNP